MDWVYTGRCWKFGDNLAVDADPVDFMAPL